MAPLPCLLPTAFVRNTAVPDVDAKNLGQSHSTSLTLVHLTAALTKERQVTAGRTRKGQIHGNERVKIEARYGVRPPQAHKCCESCGKPER